MAPFFLGFTIICSLGLGTSLILGHLQGSLEISAKYHLLSGLFSAVFASSAHCLVFGIFTGAGKDTRELSEDLKLSGDYFQKIKGFRKTMFPMALYSILLLLLTAIFGGTLSVKGGAWRWVHLTVAWFTVLYNFRAFWLEYRAIRENAALLKTVNQVAAGKADRNKSESESEVPLLSLVKDPLEWGTHVYALGRFLCFLGYNTWLPYIYIRFIMGKTNLSVWPFLIASLVFLLGGGYLKLRYQDFQPPQRALQEK